MLHYANDSANPAYLREQIAMETEGQRPYLRWVGGRQVCVFDEHHRPIVITSYTSAADLIRALDHEEAA